MNKLKKIPSRYLNGKNILNYIVNFIIINLKNEVDDFDYNNKSQIIIQSDKTINDFLNTIKLIQYKDDNNNICSSIINQYTGKILDKFTDTIYHIINLEPIFKIYDINQNDNIIIQQIESNIENNNKNTQEIIIKYNNIIKNKVSLFSINKNSNNNTIDNNNNMLSSLQEKILTRQKNAMKIKGGSNLYNLDSNNLFNKLDIIKDLKDKNKLNTIDFNNLNKIKYKYILTDRGWKKSDNSIYNKNIFNETDFYKIIKQNTSYNFPVNFTEQTNIYNFINKSNLDINDLFKYNIYKQWYFEEVPNLINKPSNIIKNSALQSYINKLFTTNISNNIITHHLNKTNYIISSKLYETSNSIYNNFTNNYINKLQLNMNLYYYNNKSYNTKYDDLNFNDMNIKMKQLFYNTKNKQQTYTIYINYIKNKFLNKIINNNIIITNQNINSKFSKLNNIFKFDIIKNINEGYTITHSQNNLKLQSNNSSYQIIRQTGNNDGYYLIKDISNDTYMYIDDINLFNDIKIINFNKPTEISDKYLFKIHTNNTIQKIPSSILRKDLLDNNYTIKFYNTNKFLNTIIQKENTVYYLDDIKNIFTLTNTNLTNNLQSTYKLEDTYNIIHIITEYIPFYSDNYNIFVIRNKDKPQSILYVNDKNQPIWININISDLLNNNDILLRSLWYFQINN